MAVKIQNLYKYCLILGLVFCGGGLSALLLLLAGMPTISNSTMMSFGSTVIIIFLIANLVIRLLNGKPLKFPFGKMVKNIVAVFAIVFFVTTVGYGIYMWPYAPLRKVDSVYLDKKDQVYSNEEFNRFKKWEFALMAFGLPFALIAISSVPSNPKFMKKKG